MNAEASRSSHIPNLNEVTAAYGEVIEHNRQHASLGRGIGNMLAGMLGVPEGEGPTAEEVYASVRSGLEDSVVEGDMHGELQGILHEGTFLRIGVIMAPLGSVFRDGDGQRASSNGLEPLLDNTVLFKDFLGTLKPREVKDLAEQKLLGDVMSMLLRTVKLCFDPKERAKLPAEMQSVVEIAGEDALRKFTEIAPQYKRLGLDDESLRKRFAKKPTSKDAWLGRNATRKTVANRQAQDEYDQGHQIARQFERLERSVEYWGKDLLPEYIVATDMQYLTPPEEQGYGPAEWQYDVGAYHWAAAFEFISQLELEPRTQEFADEVRMALIHSVNTAIGKIDSGQDTYDLIVEQRDDLENLRAALARQEYNPAMLASYIEKPTSS